VWVALATGFGVLVHFLYGPERALEFATGYVIEKALSVDNLFVFVVLFGAFQVPQKSQHRVLFWGVLGALVMRGGFIAAGSALLMRFHWLMYGFGALLVFTALKLGREAFKGEDEPTTSPLEGWAYRTLKRFVPTSSKLDGERFFTREGGRRLATPLLLVLVLVEFTDLVFAVDSIPAVFAVTGDPFIVFTSNVFAILGLRSLYFVIADMMDRFELLKYALAFILTFVGAKMLLHGVFEISIGISLGLIAFAIVAGIVASIVSSRPPKT
jgi:tellurite resistance protein TerC